MFNLVRRVLDVRWEHNPQTLAENRTNDACRWITEDLNFKHWLAGRDPERNLALLGEPGFGKTATMAYIVQGLKSGDSAFASNTPTAGTSSTTAASASQPSRNVYSYFCKRDDTDGQALNAFRSLLSQLLEDYTSLRGHFIHRVKKQNGDESPPASPKLLTDLLLELVAKLRWPTFFIIDALDECSLNDRSDLLDFLEQLVCMNRTASTRVLTSCRAASDLYSPNDLVLPEAVFICFWKLSLPQRDQRDREIAKFLVEKKKKSVSEAEVRKLLEDTLASKMKGCALWARMTLECLCFRGPGRCASVVTLRSYLEKNELPLPERLTKFYLGVFKTMTDGHHHDKWLLARSLELIAGARWRLTFDELLSALSLYTPPSKNGVPCTAKDLARLRRNMSELGKTLIRQLLLPFAYLEPTVGFVHQSIKDAVPEFPRALTDAAPSTVGDGGIGAVMLRTCADYLLLDDFGWTETTPDNKWRNRAGPRLQNDKRYCASSGNSLTKPSRGSNTDHFGAFFHYAAWNWTYHLRSAPVNFSLDDVLKLASPTSVKYRAWAHSEPDYPWHECFPISPGAMEGPLCLLAAFGNTSMLEQLLGKLALNADDSEDRRLIVAAAFAAIFGDRHGMNFRALMNHPSTKKAMQTLEMLEDFAHDGWRHLGFRWRNFGGDGRKKWTVTVTALHRDMDQAGLRSVRVTVTT